MDDPFLIRGPAVISFSGGRTSAYMLWRILQAHGGKLPDDVVVCFANTGREMPATLDFVRDCEAHWNVKVNWLEYRRAFLEGEVLVLVGPAYAVEVNHNSASRDGEPFAALIKAKRFLPNPVARFCTQELKINTIKRWFVGKFGKGVVPLDVVGLRADEEKRVAKLLDPARQKKAGARGRRVAAPLAVAGITKPDVMAFWKQQPFDLGLRGAWEGNCDGCMLKRKTFIVRLWQDQPQRAQWWADQEAIVADLTTGNGGHFRKDWKDGYAGIGRQAANMPRLPLLDADDNGADLFASCDGGCGV